MVEVEVATGRRMLLVAAAGNERRAGGGEKGRRFGRPRREAPADGEFGEGALLFGEHRRRSDVGGGRENKIEKGRT